MRHGGKILIDQLAAHGVPRVFLVPGESFLAALDALHDEPRVQTIVCRHEGGAAMMAEATGKLTGKPGVAFVTRGPGAANALPGLLIAREDETPMILVVGMPALTHEGKSAFQAIDVERLFEGVAKSLFAVRETCHIPEALAQAWSAALSGRPGPVVLAIPEDVLAAPSDVADAPINAPPRAAPAPADMTALADTIAGAEWPLMIVGGPGWTGQAQRETEAFALRFDLPVAAAFRKQDYFDNRHRCYVGHLGFGADQKLVSAIRAADLVLVAGASLGEVTAQGHTILQGSNPKQTLIRVHPSPDTLANAPRAGMNIVATMDTFAEALRTIEPQSNPPWSAFRRDLRRAYEDRHVPTSVAPFLDAAVQHLSATLPANAIVTNGAGNYAQTLHRKFQYKRHGTCLAPGYGTMGYGLPAAIAARLAEPSAPIVTFAGDGCFLMTGQELATAVQYALPLIVIVVDNGMYGTIRTQQERLYPGRVTGTTLVNPDFAALARSYGAHAETIESDSVAEFSTAFERAAGAGRPALIQLRVSAADNGSKAELHSKSSDPDVEMLPSPNEVLK